MHSLIIQVGKEPFEKEDYINFWDFSDGFVPNIADYVADLDSTGMLNGIKNVFGIRKDVFKLGERTVTIKSKELYFEQKFKDFTKYLKKVSENATLNAFIKGDLAYDLWMLNSLHNENREVYIYDGYPITMDEWMRYVKNGESYHIGGVVDYHF
jgi:hypothetical protein